MNDRLNVAIVGAGSYTGQYACKACAEESIVAVCDVDRRVLDERQAEYPQAEAFTDFRAMFDAVGDRIDAVTVSTPDHTHYAAAMAAIRRGKHVFVQKPLARTVGEVRALREAAKEHGVVTQMGNQGRAGDGIRTVREWVQAGVLGDVVEVHAWTDRPRLPWFVKPDVLPPKSIPRVEGGPIEEWLRAIKGDGRTPGSNFEYAAPLTELVLLGTLAIRAGQAIEWDPEAMRVTNAPELNRYLQIAAREGWEA